LVYCGSCGGPLVTYLQPRQGRGYGCRKDENLVCPGRVRIAAEPLEEYVAGYVIEMWKSPRALNIAQSDDDRMKRISKISSEMAQLEEQQNFRRRKLGLVASCAPQCARPSAQRSGFFTETPRARTVRAFIVPPLGLST
jgi:hypothetical protein